MRILSTETSLVKVTSDLHFATYNDQLPVLFLPGQLAALDAAITSSCLIQFPPWASRARYPWLFSCLSGCSFFPLLCWSLRFSLTSLPNVESSFFFSLLPTHSLVLSSPPKALNAIYISQIYISRLELCPKIHTPVASSTRYNRHLKANFPRTELQIAPGCPAAAFAPPSLPHLCSHPLLSSVCPDRKSYCQHLRFSLILHIQSMGTCCRCFQNIPRVQAFLTVSIAITLSHHNSLR